MGYILKKARDTKNGTTTIRLRADGTPYWQLFYEDRRKDRPEKQSRETAIPKERLDQLGINPDDTFDKVKERVKSLNARDKLARDDLRRELRIKSKISRTQTVITAFLPLEDVIEFEKTVLLKRFSGDLESLKYQRLMSHWTYVQKMIAKLEIEPKYYSEESFQIYRYFQMQGTSPAYASKLLRILNSWGQFYARRHGGMGIEAVEMPRGKKRQEIVSSYRHKETYKGPADPLTPTELETQKRHLLAYNYHWLYLSVWLGLRPEEIDNLKIPNAYRIEYEGVPVLWVWQSKLGDIEDNKTWKPIPLIHPLQLECLNIIKDLNFKRPLNKTLRPIFINKRITTYSGRKGFTDLMRSFGQDLEEISLWMGHTSIETTWKYYKQKQIVKFKKIS